MPYITEAIEQGLRHMVEHRLGNDAWPSLLRACEQDLLDVGGTRTAAQRLRHLSALVAADIGSGRTSMLFEAGMLWYTARMCTPVVQAPPRMLRQRLAEHLGSSSDLFLLGLVRGENDDRYKVKGMILHHLQPVPGCRSFTFGVLQGAGLHYRTPVELRLLEAYELNGRADIIGVEC